MRRVNDRSIRFIGVEMKDMSLVMVDPDYGVIMRGQ
jgi:uncharacterized protein with PhoU and TrkA domain